MGTNVRRFSIVSTSIFRSLMRVGAVAGCFVALQAGALAFFRFAERRREKYGSRAVRASCTRMISLS